MAHDAYDVPTAVSKDYRRMGMLDWWLRVGFRVYFWFGGSRLGVTAVTALMLARVVNTYSIKDQRDYADKFPFFIRQAMESGAARNW